MTDSLTIWGTDYTGVKGFKAKDSSNNQYAYLRPQGTKSITQNGTNIDVAEYATVDVSVSGGGGSPTIDSLTVTPSTSQQVFNSSSVDGYKPVTVEAMPSGTEGTPTATKGTVSNHSVSVTPSVTNSAGYISGGTHTGTAVTVTASELESGTKSISANGTNIDVTGYAAVDVAVPSSAPNLQAKTNISPSTSSQTIQPDNGYDGLSSVQINAMPSGSVKTPNTTIEPSVSIDVVSSTGVIVATASGSQYVWPTVSTPGYVTSGSYGTITVDGYNTKSLTTQAAQTIHPSTSNQTIASNRYLTGTQTIAAVTTNNLTAENIKNGVTVTVGDSSDPDCVASVTGTYTGGGSSKNIQVYAGYDTRKANSYGATNVQLTVAKTGTYTITWIAWRSSSSGTMGTNLHIGSAAEATNHQTFTGTYGQCITLTGQSLTQGTVITVYATSGSTSRSIYVGNLIIEEE